MSPGRTEAELLLSSSKYFSGPSEKGTESRAHHRPASLEAGATPPTLPAQHPAGSRRVPSPNQPPRSAAAWVTAGSPRCSGRASAPLGCGWGACSAAAPIPDHLQTPGGRGGRLQKELLARQGPVPGREGRPAFPGMLMAEARLGLGVGGSGQPCCQTQPPTLCSPITAAREAAWGAGQPPGPAGRTAGPSQPSRRRQLSGPYLGSGCCWLSPPHLCAHALLASPPGARGAGPLCSPPAAQPLGPRPAPRRRGALPWGSPAEVQAG